MKSSEKLKAHLDQILWDKSKKVHEGEASSDTSHADHEKFFFHKDKVKHGDLRLSVTLSST